MKKSKLALAGLLIVFACTTISAKTILYDDFTVTTGGNVNIELDRQTGLIAPITYAADNGPSTVTNAGPYAGKCLMNGDPVPAYLSPLALFQESGQFSVEFEIDRVRGVDTNKWDAFSFGTDAHFSYPHEAGTNGLEILLWEHGFYNVYINNTVATGNFYFAELQSSSNSNLKIKFIVSQPDFGTPGDALISLFINNRPYPIVRIGTEARFLINHEGGFANNFMSFLVAWTEAAIDNFKVTTFSGKNFETAAWTDVADSGISSSKVYTHAVNFCNEDDVVINGVTFTGSPSNNTSGTNWELKNDQNVIQLAQYGWGANANLSPECIPLVSNCLYDAWTSGGLTLKNLSTNLQYIITLYSIGLNSGSRPSYLIPSDGDAITLVDQNQFGDKNGQILKYKYTPAADGVFSIATSSSRGSNWVWYAFSNEIIAPEEPDNFSASQGTFSDKVRVSWNVAVGAQTYTIFRAETNVFSSATELTNGITTTTYDDSTVALKYYYYWVRADSEGGNSVEIGPALGFIFALTGPDTPSNISPADFEEVNAPAVLTASAYSGSNPFGWSEWQVSENPDFSYSTHSNWKSGKIIPTTSLTVPKNAIGSGTNYWRVRYLNKFSNTSGWSAATSFIFIPGTNDAITFFDNFNVTGSGDANKDYTSTLRQSGNLAPLTYKIEGLTEIGNSSSNPGWLTLGQNSGCSPNISFEYTNYFNIEFDVKPHNLDGSDDWFSLCFGKSSQNSFMPQSSGGAGLVFKANGEFDSYDSETFLTGGSTIPSSEKIHVLVNAFAEDFDGGTVIYSAFANGEPMLQNVNYGYIDGGGYFGNYITMFSKNSVSANSTVVDNFSIRDGNKAVMVTNWTSNADSFVDPLNDYTHLVNLNGENVDINGVTFIGTLGGSHSDTAFPNNSDYCISNGIWEIKSSEGIVNFIDGGAVIPVTGISGTSQTLAKDFCWWGMLKETGNSAAIKLFGLTPFSSNTFTIYTYAFENAGRDSYFSSSAGGIIENVEQNLYGTGNGLILKYDYIASADGTFTIVANPSGDSSFHISAFSNEETGLPEPGILFNILCSVFYLFLASRKK